MPIIDRTKQPKPNLTKTPSVGTDRRRRNGQVVNIKTVDAESRTLDRDLGFVFASNVRAAIRKKR